MADEEHLAILKQGVEAWNKWRKENPDTKPDLGEANVREADLSGADLSGADLFKANLIRADLGAANLNRTSLIRADLIETCLRRANLSRAILRGADLSRADLSGADLSGANLSRAVLREADLNGADVEGAAVEWSVFADVDLSRVKGLDTVKHLGPSTIGIDTIYKSKGKIPEVFLRGCGVPDNFIAYIGSLVGKALDYYSCFISYSSKDQECAERLHNDLQAQGVRCWFAPEDLKIGDKFRTRIDEAIRYYDKLLLVLSEQSVNSKWVEKEVETAFDKETPDHTVLFPIRLDDAVMKTDRAWAADIRRTRHIGDFCRWKDHDAYQMAFDRLLRDLKAEGTEASL
jgi:TIR domain/Pentapeptide repeats (8 copies)